MELKESFVGAKNIYLFMTGLKNPKLVTYPSSISLNKAIKMSKGEVEGDVFDVWDKLERFSYSVRSIKAFIFPIQELTRKTSKSFLKFSVLFENGETYDIMIAGENRLRIVYKQLEDIISKPVSGENMWLVIPQEQNKSAHIKYESPIVAITSSVVEDKS